MKRWNRNDLIKTHNSHCGRSCTIQQWDTVVDSAALMTHLREYSLLYDARKADKWTDSVIVARHLHLYIILRLLLDQVLLHCFSLSTFLLYFWCLEFPLLDLLVYYLLYIYEYMCLEERHWHIYKYLYKMSLLSDDLFGIFLNFRGRRYRRIGSWYGAPGWRRRLRGWGWSDQSDGEKLSSNSSQRGWWSWRNWRRGFSS